MKLQKLIGTITPSPFFSLLCIPLLVGSLSCFAQDCACTHTIESGAVDGEQLGVSPGDVLCVPGNTTYGAFRWQNIVGTAENPIIVKNCNGQVVIDSPGSYGWKWLRSKHFKILGNGDADVQYGFKVSTAKSFFVTMESFTTSFEIAHMEIVGKEKEDGHGYTGFAGIGIKTSPYQDCDLFQQKDAWTMEDVSIHDNYIHKTGGEGVYAGHGFHQGRQEPNCPDGVITYAHAIHNLHVYNNKIENVGFDGIQIKNATVNTRVHDNTIVNYGVFDHEAHNEGLLIGESTEGVFYNNKIISGTGHGMQINAYGNSHFYNNLVVDAGNDGVYLNNQSAAFENKSGVFEFHHNTLVNMGANAFTAFTPQSIIFQNNLLVNFAGEQFRGSSPVSEGNITLAEISEARFVNAAHGNYSLLADSVAVDAGVQNPAISFDINNKARTDSAADVGAYEYSPYTATVSLIPASDLSITEGESLTIDVSLVDDADELESVRYVLNGEQLATVQLEQTRYVIDAAHLQTGEHSLHAQANTVDGDFIQSSSIQIMVNPAAQDGGQQDTPDGDEQQDTPDGGEIDKAKASGGGGSTGFVFLLLVLLAGIIRPLAKPTAQKKPH